MLIRNGLRTPDDFLVRLALPETPLSTLLPPSHYRLQRLAALDAVRQRTADLRHEASLILGVSQSSRGELGGAQLVGGSGELGVLAHRLPRPDGCIPDERMPAV